MSAYELWLLISGALFVIFGIGWYDPRAGAVVAGIALIASGLFLGDQL